MNYRVLPSEYEPAMTFEEIAAALGTSMQVVWHLYSSALHKLRRYLRQHPELRRSMQSSAQTLDGTRRRPAWPDWEIGSQGGRRAGAGRKRKRA